MSKQVHKVVKDGDCLTFVHRQNVYARGGNTNWIMVVVDVVMSYMSYLQPKDLYLHMPIMYSYYLLSKKKVGVGLYLDRLHFCTIFTKLLLLT